MRQKYDGKEILKAVLFIKSSKSFNEVVDLAIYLKKKSLCKGILVNHCFIDDTNENDISRKVMSDFLEHVYCEDFKLVLVRSLKEISNVASEREEFLSAMQSYGIGVYLLDEGCFATVNYDYGC